MIVVTGRDPDEMKIRFHRASLSLFNCYTMLIVRAYRVHPYANTFNRKERREGAKDTRKFKGTAATVRTAHRLISVYRHCCICALKGQPILAQRQRLGLYIALYILRPTGAT